MSNKNIQVTLASRPVGWVKEIDFKIVETDIPKPGAGQVLVKNLYLSLDPYMRGRMNDMQSYAPNVQIGQVMVGGTAGEIVESDNLKFKAGDSVVGYFGWQQSGVSTGAELQKVLRIGRTFGACCQPKSTPVPQPGSRTSRSSANGISFTAVLFKLAARPGNTPGRTRAKA